MTARYHMFRKMEGFSSNKIVSFYKAAGRRRLINTQTKRQ